MRRFLPFFLSFSFLRAFWLSSFLAGSGAAAAGAGLDLVFFGYPTGDETMSRLQKFVVVVGLLAGVFGGLMLAPGVADAKVAIVERQGDSYTVTYSVDNSRLDVYVPPERYWYYSGHPYWWAGHTRYGYRGGGRAWDYGRDYYWPGYGYRYRNYLR